MAKYPDHCRLVPLVLRGNNIIQPVGEVGARLVRERV